MSTDLMKLPPRKTFEELGRENGDHYWYARDIMPLYGYESFKSFSHVIEKAMFACLSSKIPVHESFQQIKRNIGGKTLSDFKLTRFACYMVALSADSKKPQVARAKAYFAALAVAVRQHMQTAEEIERVRVRGELSIGENEMSGAAKVSGVFDYAAFKDAGYRGMYNMSLPQLRCTKGLDPKDKIYDFMGTEELAGNLFRVTQTSARLRKEGECGQAKAEEVAKEVGKTVRGIMIENSGIAPEHLEIEGDIQEVRKKIRRQ